MTERAVPPAEPSRPTILCADAAEASVAVLLVGGSRGDSGPVGQALNELHGCFTVTSVGSVAEATTALAEHCYGCVLVDLDAPDSGGLDAVQTLRPVLGQAALVVLAGQDDEESGPAAIAAGADDYVLKSELAPRRLRRALSLAVERARYRRQVLRLTARTEAVFDAIGSGVFVFDRDGTVTAVNAAAVQLLGSRAADMVGRHVSAAPWEFIRKDGTVLPDAERPAVRVLARVEPVICRDVGFRRPNGRAAWADVIGRPLRAPDGASDGAVLMLHDVTTRYEVESAHRFQAALLASVGQAVIVTDPGGTITYWNAAAERLYGWTAQETVGRSVLEVTPSEQTAEQAREIMAALSRGESWTGDFLVRRRDGTSFPALVTDAPVFDEAGRLTAVIGVSVDMTERSRAERTAQALSAIVTSSPDAILTVTMDGTIRSWNRGAEQLFGYVEPDVIGRSVALLDLQRGDRLVTMLAAVGAGETITGYEVAGHGRSGFEPTVLLTVTPMYDDAGEVTAASVIGRDITERRQLESQLRTQALYDSLTGLPNLALLNDRLQHAASAAQRHHRPLAVLYCDVDRFKAINDAHGHLLGNTLLQQVAHRLTTTVRPSDTVARVGGDEFVLVCEDTDTVGAEQVARRLVEAMRGPFTLDGQDRHVTVSIGIAVSSASRGDAAALVADADAAMYAAKRAGRNQARVFDESMATQASDRAQLADDLRRALDSGDLQVHYQPQIELATGRVVGLEALVRWDHPRRGWVPPASFVPLAEEHGLARELDRQVLRQACRDAAMLRARGLLAPDATVAVNRSAHTLATPDLVAEITAAAADAALPLSVLELEVTETGLMSDLDLACDTLRQLRSLGVRIALDDFGTGYSSLTYVRQLPVDTIKVDRTFVERIIDVPDDAAVATSILDLGKALRLRTVAEGIESPDQLSLLHRLGCAVGQGYLWARAVPVPELVGLLAPGAAPFAHGAPTASSRAALPRRKSRSAQATNAHGRHRIVQLHRDGASPATIAAALNSEGYRAPSGARWHANSVARVVADALVAHADR